MTATINASRVDDLHLESPVMVTNNNIDINIDIDIDISTVSVQVCLSYPTAENGRRDRGVQIATVARAGASLSGFRDKNEPGDHEENMHNRPTGVDDADEREAESATRVSFP